MPVRALESVDASPSKAPGEMELELAISRVLMFLHVLSCPSVRLPIGPDWTGLQCLCVHVLSSPVRPVRPL